MAQANGRNAARRLCLGIQLCGAAVKVRGLYQRVLVRAQKFSGFGIDRQLARLRAAGLQYQVPNERTAGRRAKPIARRHQTISDAEVVLRLFKSLLRLERGTGFFLQAVDDGAIKQRLCKRVIVAVLPRSRQLCFAQRTRGGVIAPVLFAGDCAANGRIE